MVNYIGVTDILRIVDNLGVSVFMEQLAAEIENDYRLKLRELLSSNRELARRFAQLEMRLDKKLTEHDQQIAAILSAIRANSNGTGRNLRPVQHLDFGGWQTGPVTSSGML